MPSLAEKQKSLIETDQIKQTSEWVALLYYPSLEVSNKGNQDDLIFNRPNVKLPPFVRNFQFIIPGSNRNQIIMMIPGTNKGLMFSPRME